MLDLGRCVIVENRFLSPHGAHFARRQTSKRKKEKMRWERKKNEKKQNVKTNRNTKEMQQMLIVFRQEKRKLSNGVFTMSIACRVNASHCRVSVNADMDDMLMKWRATGKRDKPQTANKDVTGATMRAHHETHSVRDNTWTRGTP